MKERERVADRNRTRPGARWWDATTSVMGGNERRWRSAKSRDGEEERRGEAAEIRMLILVGPKN